MDTIGAHYTGRELQWALLQTKGGKTHLVTEAVPVVSLYEAMAELALLGKKYKAKKPHVTLSLLTSEIEAEITQFSNLSEGELKNAVRLTAQNAWPQLISAAALGYEVFEDNGKQRVLFGIMPAKRASEVTSQLKAIAYSSFSIEFSLVSLLRLWEIKEPSIVLHAADGELLLVLCNPLVRFLYSAEFSPADPAALSTEEIGRISSELRRAVSFYRSLEKAASPKTVYVSGPFSREIASRLSASLPILPVPLRKFGFEPPERFLTAAAAALRRENSKELSFFSLKRKNAPLPLRALLIAGGIVVAVLFAALYVLRRSIIQ